MSGVTDSYLEMQVRSSTPQKLRLMLIEAAGALIERAQHAWDSGNREGFLADVARVREMAIELFASIRVDGDLEFVRATRAIYGFVIRELTRCQLEPTAAPLADLLRIFAAEQETWASVCAAETETLAGMLPQTLANLSAVSGSSLSLEA